MDGWRRRTRGEISCVYVSCIWDVLYFTASFIWGGLILGLAFYIVIVFFLFIPSWHALGSRFWTIPKRSGLKVNILQRISSALSRILKVGYAPQQARELLNRPLYAISNGLCFISHSDDFFFFFFRPVMALHPICFMTSDNTSVFSGLEPHYCIC